MKEAQKLIEDTINMIDEYEAKMEKINQPEKKFNSIMNWGICLLMLAIIIVSAIVLNQ